MELNIYQNLFPYPNGYISLFTVHLHVPCRTIDACVAIERAGPAYDGKCRTMKCRDMTDIVAPLEKLMLPGYYHNLDEEMFGGGDDGNTCRCEMYVFTFVIIVWYHM